MIEMGLRVATYVFAGLLLLFGAGPAAAEDCCKMDASNASTQCCCVDTNDLESCSPQLCAGVKYQNGATPFLSPAPDISCAIGLSDVTELAVEPPFKALLNLPPTVRRERAPPLLFADLTLCFLPPPALS